MKRKVLAIVLGLIMSATLLSSCGSSSASGETQKKTETVNSDDGGQQEETTSGTEKETNETVQTETKKAEKQQLELVETGYHIDPPNEFSDTCYVQFWAKVKNPNTDDAATFPQIKATAKSSDGTVLGTGEATGMYLMPGDTVVLTGQLDSSTNVPATIDFALDPVKLISASTLDYPSSTDFTIENVSQQKSDFGDKVTGEITYNGDKTLEEVELTAIWKSGGKGVYAESTYVDDLQPGVKTAFEISTLENEMPAYDSVEVSAQYW